MCLTKIKTEVTPTNPQTVELDNITEWATLSNKSVLGLKNRPNTMKSHLGKGVFHVDGQRKARINSEPLKSVLVHKTVNSTIQIVCYILYIRQRYTVCLMLCHNSRILAFDTWYFFQYYSKKEKITSFTQCWHWEKFTEYIRTFLQ